MPKRGENIYKRKDGRWEGRYVKKRNQHNKIFYGYVYGKKYSEVKERLILLKAKNMAEPKIIETYSGNMEDWMYYWLGTILKKTIKDSTYYNYLRLLQRHILPELGSLKLYQLKRNDIQTFVDRLYERGLSPGYIQNNYNLLKNGLAAACRREYLNETPCKQILLPKYKRKRVKALTYAQQRVLEEEALQETSCSPIILALYSGMRIGEISGLKWSDINFEENSLSICRTTSRILDEKGTKRITKLSLTAPKTLNSERVIPLAENLKRYLLINFQKANSEYVITCKGGVAEPRVINYRFKKLIEKLGMKDIHFHTLRHTFATRCLENGVDIASLSRLLGHQSTKMTLDVYTDSMLEKRQEAMKIVDTLMKQFS
ncbi:tyrosine-type recombinase/integrase [Enterococcus sp. CWB-B31]|uniref:tyrosine-type recombinase/integrase n=1 Tax=Enterococcus sp. CWB-B31 TaxID=2885159 RepID=UPI001E345C0E|nr:site-specific integrase [Enterococcus sp. CWB-B31]MCB5953520.1 site-specific integrase [Enterococcus sp. CWB-B31]